MISGFKICIVLLFLILIWLACDSFCGATKESLESLDGTEVSKSSQGSYPFSTDLDASTAPQASAPVPTDADLNQYFQNPSKDLGVPDQTAFFQNVPSSADRDNADVGEFSKQMATDLDKETFNVKDFLPQEIHEEWFQTDLSNAKKELDQASLIDISKFCQGVDTVGQSLKNASHDIRGNVPNPKIVVSPFLNSSYQPDTNIKSWC